MALSAFAAIPMNAEDEKSTDSDVIWAADFDGYSSTQTVKDYLKSVGINANTFNGTITDGKLVANSNQWWHDGAAENDPFRDLFYGVYTDENGKALTEYYMDMDYTLVTGRQTKSYTFNGTDANNNTVTYTVYSPFRGESYFNPLAGGGFDKWFFKVSPTGYLYTASNFYTTAFTTADAGIADIEYFTYTKKVGSTTEVNNQPITRDAWEEMREICGTEVTSGTTFDRVHKGTNSYKLTAGVEYTIRVKMSVDANKKVTATTYVRPANTSEAFTLVGSTSYTCNNTGEKTQAIRISEDKHQYKLDNIKFVKLGLCEGEHEFPVIANSKTDTNGFATYSEMNCLKCGMVYFTDCTEQNVLESYDFTKMSAAEYSAFKASSTYYSQSGSVNLSAGNGLAFVSDGTGTSQAGPELTLNLPEGDLEATYKMSFTTTINKIPCDQTGNVGSSFITDRTGNTFGILARIGRYPDYDTSSTTNEGWLKLRALDGGVNWNAIKPVYKLKEGETYKFDVILKPQKQLFDLYVNGSLVGSGNLNTAKWGKNVIPYYRIGNQMQLNMVLKDYSFSRLSAIPDYVLMNGSDMNLSFNRSTLNFNYDEEFGAIAENVRTETSNSSTTMYISDIDKIIRTTPFTISFDFMMTSTGAFKDAASTDVSLWSLISWINSDGNGDKYGSILRVGGIDNDESKAGFEKFFLVLNKNNGGTVAEDNGNQAYTTAAGGAVAGYISDHNSIFSFEAGEWVTISLAYNGINNSGYVYANGELVGIAAIDAVGTTSFTSGSVKSQIRIGDAYRKFHYDWAIKDISIDLTPDAPVEMKDSGTIFNIDFGKKFFVNTITKSNLGSVVYNGLNTPTIYKDTDTTDGYAHFTALAGNYSAGTSNLFNLSVTSQIGDGLYYNHLDGAKYVIETTFALYDRATTDAEKTAVEEFNAANNKNHTLPSTTSNKPVNVIRMSKYHDNNNVHLVQNPADGLIAVTKTDSSVELYVKDENGSFTRANAWYTADDLVDGKLPDDKFVKVEAVVDEADDTFSLYINGNVAYYKSGDTYKRAIDLGMKIATGSSSLTSKHPNAPESAAWLENPRYATIPRTVTDGETVRSYGTSGLSILSYIRFFQTALDFNVKSVSVTKIARDIEFVGTQTRANPESSEAFDMRFVFALDDIFVDSVEYDVTVSVNGGTEGAAETAVSDKVYKTIKSETGDINAWKYEEGDYFSVFNVNGIELGDKNTTYTFKVTPYVKEYDPATNKVERNLEKAKTTHVITVNGKGELVAYRTESAEWADIKTTYTTISEVPYKALGRTQMVNGALIADWSAAGIEFNATCVGDVSLTLSSTSTRLFTVIVDGIEYKDVPLTGGVNVIASNLPYGNHSFKIMNQNGYSNKIDIAGVTLRGSFGEAPEASSLLIEFIGDSITHGCGLGSPDYSDGTNDGTLTYAFLAAKELGADYTIMANGGMGVKWGADYDTTNLNRSMEKYPYLNDTQRGTALYEGYTEAADIVVIGLSTNDNYRFELQYKAEKKAFTTANPEATAIEITAHMDEWKTAKLAELGAELELLIAEIEKNHGKDVPIILARGMMERTLENDYPNADTEEEIAEANAAIELYHTPATYMTDLIENKWQGKYGDHVVKVAHLTPDRTGQSGHPKREGAAKQGAELAEFIKTEFPALVPAK